MYKYLLIVSTEYYHKMIMILMNVLLLVDTLDYSVSPVYQVLQRRHDQEQVD